MAVEVARVQAGLAEEERCCKDVPDDPRHQWVGEPGYEMFGEVCIQCGASRGGGV